ncbi:type IV secretion system protein VirB7 [Wolbachia endosymbiont of Pentidionis agamae]|uniref:type IV secretion system protein VirB7 n=1 Tax=Wolbachia endosymbiont of Pentidionis agamae TaxID=3110435 RepID=UPI002FD285FA
MFKRFLCMLLLLSVVFVSSGCLWKQRRLKSPCISMSNGISCELHPVNEHWIKQKIK